MQMIKNWLEGHNIAFQELPNIFDSLRPKGVNFSDWYFQNQQQQGLVIENDVIKSAYVDGSQGVGVRVIQGDQTGFSYSNIIDPAHIKEAVLYAKKIADYAPNKAFNICSASNNKKMHYPAINPIQKLGIEKMEKVLRMVQKFIAQQEEKIVHYSARLDLSSEMIAVVASDETLASDIRPLCSLSVQVVLSKNGIQESASSTIGGRFDPCDVFMKPEKIHHLVKEAVRQATINLVAQEAPAGSMPVVLGSGWPGVLLHEAIGHGLEADFHYKKTSVYTDAMNQKIASSLCTVVDDGTLADRRGSLSIDDEGVPTAYNVLIENGRLVNLMYDKQTAMLLNHKPTGNGRRESYAHLPMPRMTNTYMLPGDSHPNEILASMEKGVYAKNFSGGQVDITSGQFVFSACESYWVENGKIQYPIKGVTLVGKGSDVLNEISMVGNDLELDPGVGTCGKEGQSIPVGVGQPTLKIDNITVGGTKI